MGHLVRLCWSPSSFSTAASSHVTVWLLSAVTCIYMAREGLLEAGIVDSFQLRARQGRICTGAAQQVAQSRSQTCGSSKEEVLQGVSFRVDPAKPWALDAATVDHGSPQALVRQASSCPAMSVISRGPSCTDAADLEVVWASPTTKATPNACANGTLVWCSPSTATCHCAARGWQHPRGQRTSRGRASRRWRGSAASVAPSTAA